MLILNLSIYLNVVQIQRFGNDGKSNRSTVPSAAQVSNKPAHRLIMIIASKAHELAIDERACSDQFVLGRDGGERRLGQLVVNTLVSEFLTQHGPCRATGAVARGDPRPGEGCIVDETDLLEAIENPVDHRVLEPALNKALSKLGPSPRCKGEPAQDRCPGLALGVTLRTQAAGLII